MLFIRQTPLLNHPPVQEFLLPASTQKKWGSAAKTQLQLFLSTAEEILPNTPVSQQHAEPCLFFLVWLCCFVLRTTRGQWCGFNSVVGVAHFMRPIDLTVLFILLCCYEYCRVFFIVNQYFGIWIINMIIVTCRGIKKGLMPVHLGQNYIKHCFNMTSVPASRKKSWSSQSRWRSSAAATHSGRPVAEGIPGGSSSVPDTPQDTEKVMYSNGWHTEIH